MKRVVVLGGGISGLAAAWRLKRADASLDITVIEASARCGGKLVSELRDGFIVEAAADGFLARKPPALDWVLELGLGPELIEPRPEHRFSQVLWDEQLHAMPEGFSGLVPTNPEALRRGTLLSPEGVDRVAAESTLPLQTFGPEESVSQFFTRRFGPEAFQRLMEPLLAGIFAGDATQLSAEAAFPQLVAIERGGQSLLHGLSQTTANLAPPAKDLINAKPSPAFRSFRAGMAALPAALVSALEAGGVKLVNGQTVLSVEQAALAAGQPRMHGRAAPGESDQLRFLIRTSNQSFAADAVISALPPRRLAPLVTALTPFSQVTLSQTSSQARLQSLSEVLTDWPVSSVANLNLAFSATALPMLPKGSGFVMPRAANGPRFTAATWSSQKWPLRAPDDQLLLRIYFGGARDPTAWRLPERDLLAEALAFLARFNGGLEPQPRWYRIFRWQDAFPQPNLGHADRHRALAAAAVPGLILAGGYFAGPGIPDCLARAGKAAEEALGFLRAEH